MCCFACSENRTRPPVIRRRSCATQAGLEVYFAFENKADADQLTAIVAAKATRRYPGWASQQAFRLDGPAILAIEASLPPPRTKGKPARNVEQTVGYRIRRGSRAPFKPSE